MPLGWCWAFILQGQVGVETNSDGFGGKARSARTRGFLPLQALNPTRNISSLNQGTDNTIFSTKLWQFNLQAPVVQKVIWCYPLDTARPLRTVIYPVWLKRYHTFLGSSANLSQTLRFSYVYQSTWLKIHSRSIPYKFATLLDSHKLRPVTIFPSLSKNCSVR